MKVCILSDSHDNRLLLAAAVTDAKTRGAQVVLHCGDVVAPSTLSVLEPLGLPMHVIHGNNTGDLHAMARLAARKKGLLEFHGQDAGIRLAGRRIFLVHYPHYARAMATTGDWDLVCCGHTHKTDIRTISNIKGGETALVNPGSVGGLDGPATYALGDLDTMTFAIHAVPPIEIARVV